MVNGESKNDHLQVGDKTVSEPKDKKIVASNINRIAIV